jgi:hypothetical protein
VTPEFWVQLLTGGNVMVAIALAEGIVIVFLAKYISKLIDKIIHMTEKTAEVLEKISTDFRTRD